MLACDLVVAASDATFGLPEVTRGVLPTSGALFRAPSVLPLNVAREMILTGQRIGATRLERLGVVNRVSAPGRAVPDAVAMAQQMLTNAPLALQECVESVQAIVGEGDHLGWEVTQRAMDRLSRTSDTREGVQAFLEKRQPVWTGS